jgi:polyhydroxyalkanoate synthesis regulator phasin
MASTPKAALEAQLRRLRDVTGLDPHELLNMLETGLAVVARADRTAHVQEMELAELRLRVQSLRDEIKKAEEVVCESCAEFESLLGAARFKEESASRIAEPLLETLDKFGAPDRADHTGERHILRLCEWLEARLETCARLESEVEELKRELAVAQGWTSP